MSMVFKKKDLDAEIKKLEQKLEQLKGQRVEQLDQIYKGQDRWNRIKDLVDELQDNITHVNNVEMSYTSKISAYRIHGRRICQELENEWNI